ncbi:MAG: Transcriptional regulator, TraR/DksA family [Parcubacteria group bacterium GW2011_GWA2_38_13]|nr:MAG: Transcriptional regulator, TraR/DksA family [Parcubacteria group bacterium GW2011_GWA2_38_13]
MDKKTFKEIKKKLLEQKKVVEKGLETVGKKDDATSQDDENFNSRFPDYGDKEDENAAEVSVYSDRLAIEQELEKDIKDINKALKNIKDGSYGICKHCGKPIDERRLMIRPTSSSCVECKKRLKGEN